MEHLELDLDDPDGSMAAVLAGLDGPWQLDGPWRAEAVVDGVTMRMGLTRAPDHPWALAWTVEADVPDSWGYGAMMVAILLATATLASVAAVRGPGPAALAGSVVVLAGTLAVARRVLPGWLPDASPTRDALRQNVLNAVQQVEGIRLH